MKKKPSRKYDSEASKRRLLAAALDIFSRAGYDAATTRAIAKKAGVNDALIQRYFGGKFGLLVALIQDFYRQSVEQLVLSEPAGNLEEEIENYFRRRIEVSRKYKKFLKIAVTRAIVDPKVRDALSVFARHGNQTLLDRLENYQKRGKFQKDLDLALACRSLGAVSAMFSLFSEVIGTMDKNAVEQLLPLTAKLMAKGLG